MKINFLTPPPLDGKPPAERIFGCLVKGSIVLSNPSAAPIEALGVGDKVLTHDGSYKEVSFANKRKINEEIVKIKVKYGTPKMITKEHPVLTFSNNKMMWVASDKVKVGDKLTFPINRRITDVEKITIDTDKFHIIKEISKETDNISEISRRTGVSRSCVSKCLKSDVIGYNTRSKIPHTIPASKDLMLYFGYYLAEGSICLRKNKGGEIVFSFNESEKQFHNDIVRITKELFGLKSTIKKEKSKCVTVHVYSRPLAEFLKNEMGNGAKNKRLGKWMLELPLVKQKELIKGLFRGDGYIDKHGYEITTSSRLLAYQVKQILLRFDILCSIKECVVKDGRVWFRVRVHGSFIDKFNDVVDIKHPDSSERKENSIEFLDDYVLIPVMQKENVHFNGEVFNIEVRGNESYVLDDFVVHNCNYGLYSQPNIFVLYPATALRDAGYDVKVVDLVVENYDEKKFLEYIRLDNSDVYVFYSVFLSKKTDLLAKERIRKIRKGVKFVYIGTEPTANPKDFVDKSDVIVIRGEPEETILELIDTINKGRKLNDIKGISYFSGKLVNNPSRRPIENLDKLSIPDRTLINKEKYYNPKFPNPFTTMMTSRGCFGRCYYCVPCSLSFAREIEYKKKFKVKPIPRQRSAENVVKELKMLHEQGYKSIYFVDDQFVWWDKKRMIKIMKALKEYGFKWGALSRADTLSDEEIVKAISKTNCSFIDIGIESFDQRILDYIKKGEKVEDYYKTIALLKKYGIEPEINVLLAASPLETRETIRKTLDEVKKLDCKYVLISICTPFPHTQFYDVAKKNGWMTGKDYQPLDPIRSAQISYSHLTNKELNEIIRKAYKEFYFRPKYIFKQLLEIKSLSDVTNKIKVALKIAKM